MVNRISPMFRVKADEVPRSESSRDVRVMASGRITTGVWEQGMYSRG